ncbi:MAG: hypothetical protein U5K51_12215 [Flavobacteriaceae bacterium]|nr:hypothetical protein [Flavobacteriaceae bacterium]
MLLYLLKPKNTHLEKDIVAEKKMSPYKDKPYLVFWIAMFLIGFCFMQYFSTLPIFYNEKYHLTEKEIGYLLAMNGFVIFLIEMPVVHYLDKLKMDEN